MKFSALVLFVAVVFIGCAKKTVLSEEPETAISGGIISSYAVGEEPLIGFAAYNGTTTGGTGGSTVTVSSFSALKSVLQANDSFKIVYVSGAIVGAGEDPIYVKSNKSIIGLSGASIEGASFQLIGSGVSNVIIQNLKISNYLTYGAVTVSEGAHHVWINHCEFSVDRNHGWDYYSKDIIVARGSDYVTISWNIFHDQFLSVLISSGINSQSEATDVGKLHVTLHHNYWYNISEREPTMNYGSVHMFNNYHLNNNGYSIGARAGGNVRTDNEYFSGCNLPISTDLAGDPPGYITGANTNIYVSCDSNNITTAAGNWAPPYSYASALNAAADVPTVVLASAGTYSSPPVPDTLQAENAVIAGGAIFDDGFSGWNGTGFINPPSSGGSIQFNNVDGNGGGTKALQIRYSLGSSPARSAQLVVNGGSPISITASPTGAWDSWATLTVNVALNNNSSNTIRIQTNGSDWGLVDQIIVPLTIAPPVPDTLQAENSLLAGGAVFEFGYAGFNGSGYVNPPSSGGSIEFDNVDGNGGGTKSIAIRYSLLSGPSRNAQLIINGGTPVTITASSTGSWSTWTTLNQSITLNNNSTNTIKILTNGSDWGLVDQIIVP